MTTHSHVAALAALAVTVLAGCSSPPPAAPTPVATSAPAPVAKPAPTPAPVAPPVAVARALPAYLDANSPISKERSVYFDFDDQRIKSEYFALIERHGKYLATMPALSIKVEGNADERGSAEYNLALGQRRATAVVNALKVYGVKDTQVEAVSWGKEHPKATGHDEAAWAQNRRADLTYPKQ